MQVQNPLKEVLSNSFPLFRRYLHGNKLVFKGWQIEAELKLEQFAKDMVDGKHPVMLISAPPQHGKSQLITDFLTWMILTKPDTKALYASISAFLCARAVKTLRRHLAEPHIIAVFGDTRGAINQAKVIEISNRSSLVGTTVNGVSIGLTVDLAIIDDPCKNRAESLSARKRSLVKDWFDNDLTSRMTKNGGILSIQTRWHVDDLYAHILNVMPWATECKYTAIQEDGSALFEELKPIEFLLRKKAAMSAFDWESLYMSNPVVLGGELFDVDAIRYYVDPPTRYKLKWIVADTASTVNTSSDYTVFSFFGITEDNKLYLLDYFRKKMEVAELVPALKSFWARCHGAQYVSIENKSSGIGVIQELRKTTMRVKEIQRKEDKVTRALGVSAYISNGSLYMPEHTRGGELLAELSAFPAGKHDDFADTLIDGLQTLAQFTSENRVAFNRVDVINRQYSER